MGLEVVQLETEEPPGTVAIQEQQEPWRTALTDIQSAETALEAARAVQGGRRRRIGCEPCSAKSFRLRWYPGVSAAQWSDWRWQYRNRITSFEQLGRMFKLSAEEAAAFASSDTHLPLAITPYYASLIPHDDSSHALRRSMIPVVAEASVGPGEAADPLGEGDQSPLPGLVHRYPDRVLFLVTNACSCYCRYCTRSRMVGRDAHGGGAAGVAAWRQGLDYIRCHPEIRDVLLSGGDPLMLSDEALEWLLMELRAIPHVEIVRIGTKAPVVLPQRVTPGLVRVLRRSHPLWMSIHFTHPFELTRDVEAACGRLADAGIPLGSQTVLLAGVNDTPEVLRDLFHGLLKFRVRPYYLYQCDPINGSAHFRTSVARGVEIIKTLRGWTSGYAVPNFVVDAPGGGGKVPVTPDYVVGYRDGDLVLRNYQGQEYRYPDLGEKIDGVGEAGR